MPILTVLCCRLLPQAVDNIPTWSCHVFLFGQLCVRSTGACGRAKMRHYPRMPWLEFLGGWLATTTLQSCTKFVLFMRVNPIDDGNAERPRASMGRNCVCTSLSLFKVAANSVVVTYNSPNICQLFGCISAATEQLG